MENPHKLRKLAGWYREFAERAGNPAIWHARLVTAEDLEREADRLEKIARKDRVAVSRAAAMLAFAAGLLVAAIGAGADEPTRSQPTVKRAGTDSVRAQPTAKLFAPPHQPDDSAGAARVVDELYRQLIGPPPAISPDSRPSAPPSGRATY